jgi:thymidylate synthase (FAD)
LLKHRISSLNAESARYKELKEDKFYIPEDWPIYWQQALVDYTVKGNELYHECLAKLEEAGVDRKRAKESARFFKTYNSQIQSDIMFNWRSFVNFQKLRNSEHAQLEIRDIAAKMLDAVKNIKGNPFKHTIEAFSL